jgi:membrane-bound ClpP family serine protease
MLASGSGTNPFGNLVREIRSGYNGKRGRDEVAMLATLIVGVVIVGVLVLVGMHFGPHASIVTGIVGAVIGFVGAIAVQHATASLAALLWALVGVIFLFGIVSVASGLRGLRSTQMHPVGSASQLVKLMDTAGTALTRIDPVGTVRIAGGTWTAKVDGDEPIEPGTTVFVTHVEGLTLHVIPEAPAGPAPTARDRELP